MSYVNGFLNQLAEFGFVDKIFSNIKLLDSSGVGARGPRIG